MAATGYTPIQLYYSTTASAVPLAANLANGELALNTADMKLYAKNSSGVVTLLASNAGSSGTVSSVAQSFTGGLISVTGSPITTSGTLALTVAGTSGGIPYFSSGTTWASSAALAANALMIGGGAGAAPSTTTTGAGILTFLGTPSSANLAAAVTDETGSGSLVFGTSPSLTTPALSGETFSTSATVTAGTNAQGQGALTSDYSVITTAASNPSGVTLPTATTGRRIIIVNKGANAVNVYPDTGGTIDALAANAAISLPVNGWMQFNASSTTQWYSTANITTASSGVTSFSAGTTGLTPSTATTGAVTLAGTLAVANGGTGQTSYTDGQLLIGNSTGNTLTKATLTAGSGVSITNGGGSITIAATGSGGTVTSVSWTGGIVSIANATTTPAFTIAGTSGGIPYFSSASTWATSAALTANALMIGGGAGAAPSTITTGTGVVTALGNTTNTASGLVTGTGTVTLQNKRIDPRVSSTTSSASITPDISAYDQYCLTAQAVGLTVNAPTGTPVDGDKLMFRFLDNGTSQTITWNATFTVIGTTLPTATTANKMVYVGCIYNAANTRWDVVAVTTQA